MKLLLWSTLEWEMPAGRLLFCCENQTAEKWRRTTKWAEKKIRNMNPCHWKNWKLTYRRSPDGSHEVVWRLIRNWRREQFPESVQTVTWTEGGKNIWWTEKNFSSIYRRQSKTICLRATQMQASMMSPSYSCSNQNTESDLKCFWHGLESSWQYVEYDIFNVRDHFIWYIRWKMKMPCAGTIRFPRA